MLLQAKWKFVCVCVWTAQPRTSMSNPITLTATTSSTGPVRQPVTSTTATNSMAAPVTGINVRSTLAHTTSLPSPATRKQVRQEEQSLQADGGVVLGGSAPGVALPLLTLLLSLTVAFSTASLPAILWCHWSWSYMAPVKECWSSPTFFGPTSTDTNWNLYVTDWRCLWINVYIWIEKLIIFFLFFLCGVLEMSAVCLCQFEGAR